MSNCYYRNRPLPHLLEQKVPTRSLKFPQNTVICLKLCTQVLTSFHFHFAYTLKGDVDRFFDLEVFEFRVLGKKKG